MLVFACSILLISCASTTTAKSSAKAAPLYVCGCSDCTCQTVALKPGKCTCGKDLVGVHPLKIEGDSVLACPCGADCTCVWDAKDPGNCGCGKPIRKIALKGSGLYYCACGGSCCVTLSDKPGKCKCGRDLKKAG